MGLNHLEPAYTDQAADLIEEFGGKFGGLEFLRTHVPGLAANILPLEIVNNEGGGSSGISVNPGSRIVRASHRNDFQGLVDVLQTKVVKAGKSVDRVIELIREQVGFENVVDYARYENPTYDPKDVVVGVQPHIKGRRGSMVEHPNRPGEYVISWYDEGAPRGNDYGTYLYDQDGNLLQNFWIGLKPSERVKALIAIYKEVVRSGLVKGDICFQMEFGDSKYADGPLIYQVRAMMRKRIADFKLDASGFSDKERLVFGVTSETGMELPVVHVHTMSHGWQDDLEPKEPYALLKSTHDDFGDEARHFRPRHLTAFLPRFGLGFNNGKPGLEHNQFRYIQKADVTVSQNHFDNRDFLDLLTDRDLETLRWDDKFGLEKITGLLSTRVRIITDGRNSIVEPVR